MEKISVRPLKDYMRASDSMLSANSMLAADSSGTADGRLSKTVLVAAHLEDSVAHAVFSKVKDSFNALRDKFGRLSRLAGEGRERGLTYEEEDEILAELAGSLCDCLDEAIAEAARAGGRAASEIACGFENSGLIQWNPWQDGARVVKDGVAVARSADGEYTPEDEDGEDSGLVDVRGDAKVADWAKKLRAISGEIKLQEGKPVVYASKKRRKAGVSERKDARLAEVFGDDGGQPNGDGGEIFEF